MHCAEVVFLYFLWVKSFLQIVDEDILLVSDIVFYPEWETRSLLNWIFIIDVVHWKIVPFSRCYEGTKIYLNVLSHTDLIKLFDKKKKPIFSNLIDPKIGLSSCIIYIAGDILGSDKVYIIP